MSKFEEQRLADHKAEEGIEEKYILCADLLEDIWLNLDWDKVDNSRRRKIWEEFENQVRASSRCFSRLQPFLDKLCKRFDSCLFKKETREILGKKQDELFLEVFRSETQIPMLLLRLRREQASLDFKARQDE